MIPKSQMTEEDVKHLLITPAIEKTWAPTQLAMERKITDGRINLRGNLVSRENAKKADYVLYIAANYPIAIVEAKDNKHTVSDGIQQAIEYAVMLDVPFAYSSNGDAFYERDFLTGKERTIPLDQFPSPDELMERYRRGANGGEGLNEQEVALIQQPYYTSVKTHAPRYYQRIAINRTLDAIARGQSRILIVMATGTGKTYTAFQIVYRALKGGMKKKILYLVFSQALPLMWL